MLLLVVAYFILFKYIPLLGSVIAFKDYNIFEGFIKSKWVGFDWFVTLYKQPQFMKIFKNTLVVSFYQVAFSFPAPIILALLLNEVRKFAYKRSVQTIVYLPHFLSWALVFGMAYMMFSPQTGLVNQVLGHFEIGPKGELVEIPSGQLVCLRE